jgi:hypothetical protein
MFNLFLSNRDLFLSYLSVNNERVRKKLVGSDLSGKIQGGFHILQDLIESYPMGDSMYPTIPHDNDSFLAKKGIHHPVPI